MEEESILLLTDTQGCQLFKRQAMEFSLSNSTLNMLMESGASKHIAINHTHALWWEASDTSTYKISRWIRDADKREKDTSNLKTLDSRSTSVSLFC